ncbi:MAG: hypothetical protein H8F28_05630 [Fibrella sp.]|nr:hypothetical protein [Armatimonadota bacterium]
MMLRNANRYARIGVLTLAIITTLSGCDNDAKGGSGGKESDFITENPSKKTELPKGTGPLWSLTPGKSWRTITMRQQKNVDSEIRVVGPYRVVDGRTGMMVRSSRAGKPFRIEIYQTDPSGGMKLLALGETEKKLLVFSPAIPVLKYPVKEGEYLQWSGTARLEKQEFGAIAFHRISAVDSVKTPFDTILAYRLDGIISLNSGTQRVDYPAVMWFVPGKGVAQRRLADRGVVAFEMITKFSP